MWFHINNNVYLNHKCKMLHYYLSSTCFESRVSLENKTFNQHARVNCGSYGYLSCFMLDTWSQFFTFRKGFWHVGKNVIGQWFMVPLSSNWWPIQLPLQIADHNLIVIPKWNKVCCEPSVYNDLLILHLLWRKLR